MTMLVEALREQLHAATTRSIASSEDEVRTAVRLIAALVREEYPSAKRVELESSDQGDWLRVVSIDGDEAMSEDLDEDELGSAAMCIYDAHRTASPALHPTNGSIYRTEFLFIDIEEALK